MVSQAAVPFACSQSFALQRRAPTTQMFPPPLLALLALLLLFAPHIVHSHETGPDAGAAGASKRVVGYFTSWSIYARSYTVSSIPADQLTHLNYAFANINLENEIVLGDSWADVEKLFPGDTWEQPLRGNFWQMNRVLKEKFPHVKTLISIGGWTWSARFSDVALTDRSRRRFAESCKTFIEKYGFDGVDIDWEYPVEGGLPENKYRPEDGANYVLLLKAVRDAIGPQKLLTIAAPAGPSIMRHLKVREMEPYLDWVNIMTYDYQGGWSTRTGHQTPLFANARDPDNKQLNTDFAVQWYVKQGMPASKLCIGAAVYGRSFANVSPGNDGNGLFQPFSGVPTGTWDATGVFDYKDIVMRVANGEYQRYWDDEAKAVYAYNPQTKVLISYDDPDSIRAKMAYVLEKGVGGVMFWELSGDTQDLTSIVRTIHMSLGDPLPPTVPPVQPSPTCPPATTTVTRTRTVTQSCSGQPKPTSTSLPLPPTPTNTCPVPGGAGGVAVTPLLDMHCADITQSCSQITEPLSCLGPHIGVCSPLNSWMVIRCPPGMRCQIANNAVDCQEVERLVPGGLIC